MHRRTLNRRLEGRDCTFQELVDEVRFEIARQLLENTHMSMSQIAATFDYSDASAFTRAFRRWPGIAPTAWRSRSSALESTHAPLTTSPLNVMLSGLFLKSSLF
ncbi:MAG: AraC family transcriptional regulator [Candidatus Competibacteraceae bacterium]|nr:AraC family transcriptional regulator [Candidatus Competibacteraceae bacterium]